MVGDFNGDGKMDIVGRDANSGQLWVNTVNSAGTSFNANALWGTFSTAVTWSTFHADNFGQFGIVVLPGQGRSAAPLRISSISNFTTSTGGTSSNPNQSAPKSTTPSSLSVGFQSAPLAATQQNSQI